MRCAHCGAPIDGSDNFCRRCGVTLNRLNVPTVVSRSLLPVPWARARGPLVRGVAALAVGTAVGLVRREVMRRIASTDPSQALAALASGGAVGPKRGRFPWSRSPRGDYEVTETVVQRTIRFFRR